MGDPATGTLQIPADVRAKAIKALNREVRRMKMRLRIRRFYFKVAEGVLEAVRTVAKVLGVSKRGLRQFIFHIRPH